MVTRQLACTWLALLVCFFSWPLTIADADFQSVRVGLEKDWSGKAGDPPQKYFRE